nr:hypothetical protein [Tanacetum cinerariifolium]
MAQQPQQQIIPADQLVSTRYQSIGRCNNYVRKQTVDETSSPKPSLKIHVKQFQSSITPISTSTYDDDDFDNMIELESHKEHPEIVDDDENENEKEKKYDNNDDDVNDDHTNHTLDETHEIGSLETRNEKMQTPIPLPR